MRSMTNHLCAYVLPILVLCTVVVVPFGLDKCQTSEDCRTGAGLSFCNNITGQCDCTFALTKNGFFCDKVCTDHDQRQQCVNGQCRYDNTDFFDFGECTCDAGYTADVDSGLCTEPICSRPCLNGGFCVSPDVCLCDEGFTGRQCETTVRCVDIIAPANGSTRKFESGGLQHQSFDCNTGFVLNGSRLSTCNNVRWDPAKPPTCVDFDECATGQHDCERQCGSCVNFVGGYRCDVPPENRNLIYDREQMKCCAPNEPCEPTCFPISGVNFGKVTYDPPLFSDSDPILALTIATLTCLPGFELPPTAVTKVTCTKNGAFDGVLSACVQINVSAPSPSTPATAATPVPNLVEEEEPRSGSDTALIASLVTVTVVIILAVLIFLYFRARTTERKYTNPPAAESPPLDKKPANGAGFLPPSSLAARGRGPPMHTTSLPPAVASAIHERPSRVVHRDHDDGVIYASAETWTDGNAPAKTTATGTRSSAIPPLNTLNMVTEVNPESQHYASCDLNLNADEDAYEDAFSISPNKATTLPNSLPAEPTFLGPSRHAEILPAVSPSKRSAAASAIAAAASAVKRRPQMFQSKQQRQQPEVPQAQRPSALSKKQKSIREGVLVTSDSEYENASTASSPPSSPPFNVTSRSQPASRQTSDQPDTASKRQVFRPKSTSPPVHASDTSTVTSSKSSSPPPVLETIEPNPDSTQAHKHAWKGEPYAQSEDSIDYAVDAELPPVDKKTSLSARNSKSPPTLQKPSHPPPKAPVGSADSNTSPSSTLEKTANSALPSEEPLASDVKPEEKARSFKPAGKPVLPSKANRPKLDVDEEELPDLPSQPVAVVTKPDRPPRPRVTAKSSKTAIATTTAAAHDEGYLPPNSDDKSVLQSSPSTSAKPTPPPKHNRPSLQPDNHGSAEAVADKPSSVKKPPPPPKAGRPSLSPSNSTERFIEEEKPADNTPPMVARKPSKVAPPRTASMPRFPSPPLSLSDN